MSFIACLFLTASDLMGQRRDTAPPGTSGRSKMEEMVTGAKIDSINIFTFKLDENFKTDTFKPRGLTKYFQQYDPARGEDFEYGHLGNLGSASYPLAYNFGRKAKYTLGFKQYDLYHKDENDVIYFSQNTPFSELYFSGGESQTELRVGALFSRTFNKTLNWIIDYDRISQDGIYNNQAVKQTSFLTGLAYQPEKSRISAFTYFLLNASYEEINGGVERLSSLEDPGSAIRQNVATFLSDAESRFQNLNVRGNIFYRLGNDTIVSDFKNSFEYELDYFNEFYRYSDDGISSDSNFYGNYYGDTRGIRNYMEHWKLQNSFYFNSSFKEYYYFKAGISHQLNLINLSSFSNGFNDVFIKFSGGINLLNRLSIKSQAFYGILNAANLFGITAKANLRLTERQGFNFIFRTGRYRPNQIETRIVINEELFFENDFKKLWNQTLGAEYYNRKLRFKAGARVQNTVNFIYFDSTGVAVQTDELFAVSLLYLGYDLKIKSLLLENFVFLQNKNKQFANLPSVFTKNSISFYGRIFKDKMLLKAGFDFRYIISDNIPSYNPVIGQFQLNTSKEFKPYPLIDARISFKVSSFTTFAKYENLLSLINNDVEFLVLNHPQFDARFRFGILWNLWN